MIRQSTFFTTYFYLTKLVREQEATYHASHASMLTMAPSPLVRNHVETWQGHGTHWQKNIGAQLGLVHINLMQWTIKKHVYSFKKHLFPINPEEIVLALCPLIEKATQPHPSGKGMVPYQIGMCPRKDTCSLVTLRYSERRRIKFKYKTRYINPQKHFLHAPWAMITSTCWAWRSRPFWKNIPICLLP